MLKCHLLADKEIILYEYINTYCSATGALKSSLSCKTHVTLQPICVKWVSFLLLGGLMRCHRAVCFSDYLFIATVHALASLLNLYVFSLHFCCQSLSILCSVHMQGEKGVTGVPGEKGERGDPVCIFLPWHLQCCCVTESLTKDSFHRVSQVPRGLAARKDKK